MSKSEPDGKRATTVLGGKVLITSLGHAAEGLRGETDTIITADNK